MAALLEKQAGREWVPHLNRAWPYIALSDRERALAHIEAAIPDRETDLLFLGADAIYDPLRQEPRFRAVLRRLGLAK